MRLYYVHDGRSVLVKAVYVANVQLRAAILKCYALLPGVPAAIGELMGYSEMTLPQKDSSVTYAPYHTLLHPLLSTAASNTQASTGK